MNHGSVHKFALLALLVMSAPVTAEELPFGATSVRAHTSHGRKFEYTPEQSFERTWQFIKDRNYDQSFGGQDWDRWHHKYDGRLMTYDDAYKAIDTMLISLRLNPVQVDDHMRFCDYEWKWLPKGIGVGLTTDKSNRTLISSIFANSIATGNASLLPGDIILAVNGKSMQGVVSQKMPNFIQGEPDSPVSITVQRGPSVKTIQVRRNWSSSALGPCGMIDEKIGYINIIDPSSYKMIEKVKEKLKSFADASGLIIDLRATTCRSLFAQKNVADFCDLFLTEGVTLSYQDFDGQHTQSAAPSVEYGGGLVILVNDSVQGISELIAGLLKDNGRAILVGEQTRGNPGSINSTFNIDTDTFCTLKSGHYNRISGKPFDQPLLPDESISLTRHDYETGKGPWWYMQSSLPSTELAIRDLQLIHAVDLLKQKSSSRRG
ncbi:MAG: hypothetical protein K2X81_07615 [Candidatus Obscuribacterales bacterium]|nr:hypothetical protein [Candidatus Obscuribacterales bacterium]